MPSFDVVSEVDMHEVTNAVDQANREVGTRFDFKGTGAQYELSEQQILMTAQAEFQLQQMLDIVQTKLSRRGVDIDCLEILDPQQSGMKATQTLRVREGLDAPLAKQVVKAIKDAKLKVQAQIQGNQVRVTGKKRDDLQAVIALLKGGQYEMPLQFSNFRD